MPHNNNTPLDHNATADTIARDNVEARKASEESSTFAEYTVTADAIAKESAAAKELADLPQVEAT